MPEGLEARLKWKGQADGISCGPASVRMLVGMLGNAEPSLHPFEVRDMMGTNPMTGTTEVEMSRAMRAWGLPHRRMLPQPEEDGRMSRLIRWLEAGNPALLRGMRHGGKHWILAVGMDEGKFLVADPASGVERIREASMRSILAPRGWEIWAVPGRAVPHKLELGAVGEEGANEALELCSHVLGTHLTEIPLEVICETIDQDADWDLSVALRVNGHIRACYVLRETDIHYALSKENVNNPDVLQVTEHLENKRCAWGIALACRADSRDKGYGRLVRSMPGQLGFDASFGFQLKDLNNSEEWAKIRPWRADLGSIWLTAGPVFPLRAIGISSQATPMDMEFPVTQTRRKDFR